jgi:hypothetical protein
MIIKKDQAITQNCLEDNSGVKGFSAYFVAIAETEGDIQEFLVQMSKSSPPVAVVGALTGNAASGLAFWDAILSLEKLNKNKRNRKNWRYQCTYNRSSWCTN